MNIGAAICFDRRYYALAAAAALLKYVEYIQHMVYAPKSMRIEFQGSPNTTMIDIESARSLELVVSQSKQSIVSLLGTMNRCLTPMGRRLLRASILQPSCDECLIAYRQSCVAELVANYSLCTSLQPVVQRLFGTDRLLMLAIKPLHVNDMQNAERNLNYALLLKSCLDTIPELEAILATGVHPFFVKTRKARKNRRSITMTTTALLTLNKQCKNACEEIYMMSNTLLTNLLEDIRQHVGCLFQLSADVAELDLILSLAQISSNPEYVRPSFGAKLELINSLHPIMELFNRDLPVANDVNASITHNFHLITGPNMSGKSTYLKQIVLLQIMAQMKEAQYILQSVTPKSLVILDELCRHTTVEEGSAIAWAICEKLSLTTAFTFAATHFLHLTALSNMYHNVTSHCFETKTAESEESNDLHLIYTHKLNPGRGPTDHYGIALAEVSSLPKCVTIKAREYASQQSVNIQNNNFRSITTSPSWEKSCYNAIVQLRALLENNRFTFANIISIMKQLDLSKQTKRAAQVQVKSPNVVQECREQEKCEEEKNLVVASNNNLTRTEDVVSLLLVPMNKDEQKVIENKVQDEPMEIIENDNRKADESIHDVILNQKALSLPETVNRSPSTANPDFSLLNDPRFYVCTSFTASTPKITLQFCEANLGSSFTANSSVAASPSFNASQSIEYHDYCLSEGEFDITLPSQSTPSDIAKMTARSKEAKIFRQIEGGDFNEDSFFNDTQTTLKLNLSMDNDDVMMLPM
ncbi:MutS protein-like protein 4 [Acromyrmex echinatior]|uniref:MutS protein-like protein 4 n=1 Tax=Acromyrmex echinatior TaxID=103372 RepID=F4WVN4_ACREC|nr:MutS protein-like protein 4 [Acromyrmex echinatior]